MLSFVIRVTITMDTRLYCVQHQNCSDGYLRLVESWKQRKAHLTVALGTKRGSMPLTNNALTMEL